MSSRQKTERKWQEFWAAKKITSPDLDRARKPFYNLTMFPYPSAEGLHIGNVYDMVGADIYGRFKKLLGFDVFQPMGYDAFGIHSENYAIKLNKHPQKVVAQNIKNFRKQIDSLGTIFDFSREVDTTKPEYYKWTQWIFLQLFKNGLAYRAKAPVNWCPSCKTVLADEQAEGGVCERCGAEVVQKELDQWFFKITEYADRLLNNLDKIDWSESIKTAQRNWIGKSEGVVIKFPIINTKFPNKSQFSNLKFDEKLVPLVLSGEKYITYKLNNKGFKAGDICEFINSQTSERFSLAKITKVEKKKLGEISEKQEGHEKFKSRKEFYRTYKKYYNTKVDDNTDCWLYYFELIPDFIDVFTTRLDTIFGATYLVLAPEHEVTSNIKYQISNIDEAERYISGSRKKTREERIASKDKSGVELKGIKAINPATNEEIPIWVADYVLGGYGTGAIMAVPAHDERDFEFAEKYNLPIKQVIAPYFKDDPVADKDTEKRDLAVAIVRNPKNNAYLCLNWKTTGWKSFPAGGVDGADLVEAAKREVKEETGYANLKFIKQIGNSVYAEFYRPHKDLNVFAHFKYLLFELENEVRNEVSQKEKDQHETIWVEEDKVGSFINVWNQKIVWKKYRQGDCAYCEDGILIDSGEFSGLKSAEAREKMADWLKKNNIGKKKINYKLRDWTISRQRYWGPPIPVIYCDKCPEIQNPKFQIPNKIQIPKPPPATPRDAGLALRAGKLQITVIDGKEYAVVPVLEKDLPVKLPKVKDFRPKGTGVSPLAQNKSFVKVKCPDCGGEAKRETDVSDNFLDSAWYFLRYPSGDFSDRPFDKKRTEKWLPPDMYRGGPEHAVLHMMYSRFINMALYDMKFLPFEEPFPRFRVHGLITKGGVKMSKSRGNIVEPDEYIKKYGADVMRMHLMFLGPYEAGGDFNDKNIIGIERFLGRARELINIKYQISNIKNTNKKLKAVKPAPVDRKELEKNIHKAIKKVGEHLETMQFNTAIAALMELLNAMGARREAVSKKDLETFILLLAPFAPHIAEEIWEKLGNKPSVFFQRWPAYEEGKIKEEEIDLVIQINGKVRDKMRVESGISGKEIENMALQRDKIVKFLGGEKPKRVIVVSGRLVNIVIP